MSDEKERIDGTDKLCLELYGRKGGTAEYLGGSDAKMLFDAAAKIAELKVEISCTKRELRESRQCAERLGDEVIAFAQELVQARASRDEAVLVERQARKSEVNVRIEVERGPEHFQGISLRAMVDGNQVASAAASPDHLNLAWNDFIKTSSQIFEEMKASLRNHVRGLLERVTVLESKSVPQMSMFKGRVLVREGTSNVKLVPRFVNYDLSTGETGPDSVDDHIRNSFRRHVHNSLLRRLEASKVTDA